MNSLAELDSSLGSSGVVPDIVRSGGVSDWEEKEKTSSTQCVISFFSGLYALHTFQLF